MDVETSVDKFGTVYLSTKFMELLIHIGEDEASFADWISHVPYDLRARCIGAIKQASCSIPMDLETFEFKARFIEEIQSLMLQQPASSWWRDIVRGKKNGRIVDF